MTTTIVGIDCAVQPRNVGLALGRFDGRVGELEQVMLGSKEPSIAETLAGWIGSESRVLLTLDAPLGWPAPLGSALSQHQAGGPIQPPPNELFRRLTDRVIKEKIKKQPLDVGADRIARTAHAALELLTELRQSTGEPIPLAWSPTRASRIEAIEVYPAATLAVYGLTTPGYKRKDGRTARQSLLRSLRELINLPGDLTLMEQSDDALDAAVCVLAGADFLRGDVIEPTEMETARKEGWIWVRKPGRS